MRSVWINQGNIQRYASISIMESPQTDLKYESTSMQPIFHHDGLVNMLKIIVIKKLLKYLLKIWGLSCKVRQITLNAVRRCWNMSSEKKFLGIFKNVNKVVTSEILYLYPCSTGNSKFTTSQIYLGRKKWKQYFLPYISILVMKQYACFMASKQKRKLAIQV